MPRFAANLSMMFTEVPFIERFAAARKAGFDAVEFLFPYDYSTLQIQKQLEPNHLTLLNCEQVHVMAGVVPAGEDAERYRAVFIDNLRYAADRFAPHGKRILVEALSPGVKPHYLFSSQYQALAIVEEVARDNVFIQLDTFHAQKVDGNLTHLIRDYAGKYAHVQIAGLPDRHEPDDGEINYPWLFRLFDEVGYQGWIGCEYKPRGLTEEGLGWFDAWR